MPAGSFIGRDEDLTAIPVLFGGDQARLVTLTGPGGVGKTRLALEVAHTWPSRDGARFVPLAGVQDPRLVVPELARVLGIPSASAVEVGATLADMDVLVVLDNFEHVSDAAAPIAEVLAGAPGASVLVTSRTALRIRGEVEYQVHPLSLPAPSGGDTSALLASPAAALLLSRGRAVRRDLDLTPTQASAVVGICHRLSGLPLALELAAAGLRTLEPVGLLAHLDEVLLAPGPVDLPGRQHTIRATLQWSYELLTPELADGFRRLSVFVDGFQLDAANAVLAANDAHRLLQELAAHSLCTASGGEDGELRYQMLALVAEFGRGLWQDEEASSTHAAHCAYFLKFAEQALEDTHGSAQMRSLQELDREAGNLSAAFEWAVMRGEGELAGRFVWALWMFWWLRGYAAWARQRIASALALPMSASARARVLIAAGGIADPADGSSAAASKYQEAARLAARCGDGEAQASAALALGTISLADQNYLAAREQLVKAVSAAESVGPDGLWYAGHALVLLGAALRFHGDLLGAVESVTAGLNRARARGDAVATTIALYNLGQVYLSLDKPHLAQRQLLEAASLSIATRDTVDLANVLAALACAARESPHCSATLFGAADALRSETPGASYGFYAPDAAQSRRGQERTREALGELAYVEAYEAGRQFTMSQAVEYARSCAGPPTDS